MTTFTIKINAIRTTTIGDKTDVVKQVDWTITGTQGNQSFELPQTTALPDPDMQQYVPLNQLTETQVVAWVESHDANMESTKAHIQYVLDRDAASANLVGTPMPWAPVVGEPSVVSL